MVEEDRVAVVSVLEEGRLRRGGIGNGVARHQVVHHIGDRGSAEHLGERRHPTGPLTDDRRDLLTRSALRNVEQRWRGRIALPVLPMTARARVLVERAVIARDQLQQPCHLVRVDVEQPGLRIEGRPAPFGAAVVSREDDEPIGARRLKHPGVPVLAERLQCGRVRFGRPIREHALGQRLPHERRWLARDRLGRARLLAVDARRGNLPIVDGKQRLSALAVEHEDEARLGYLRDGVDRPPVLLDRDQRRRRRQVHVPEIVLQGLEVPDALACARVQRDHTVREQVVAVPVRAVEIERRRARGGEHHPHRVVYGEPCPRVRAAGNLVRVGRPRVVAELARAGNRVERPPDLTGHRVERPDVARRRR